MWQKFKRKLLKSITKCLAVNSLQANKKLDCVIMKQKVRAQVKSRFYYIFWGIATIAVVAGQLVCWNWISPSSWWICKN